MKKNLQLAFIMLLVMFGVNISLSQTVDELIKQGDQFVSCLLYTSDAADERSSVDLGGRRIIKKKKKKKNKREWQTGEKTKRSKRDKRKV